MCASRGQVSVLTLSTEGQQRIYSMPTSPHFLVAGLHANSYLQDFSAAENQLRAFSRAAKANGPYVQYRLACTLLAECAAALLRCTSVLCIAIAHVIITFLHAR